jgi:hypothetical protein
MIKYELNIKLTVKVADEDITDVYIESGSGPYDNDFDENMDMFIKPRVTAGGSILINKMKNRKKDLINGN